MALTNTVQEALHLRALLSDLGHQQNDATLIYQNNQGSIALAKNAVVSQRTKHIDIRYHFVRERLDRNEVRLEYLPTQKMIADCLTKPVSQEILRRLKQNTFGNELTKFRSRESVEDDDLTQSYKSENRSRSKTNIGM